jgi:hypothetical protein
MPRLPSRILGTLRRSSRVLARMGRRCPSFVVCGVSSRDFSLDWLDDANHTAAGTARACRKAPDQDREAERCS